MTRRTVQPNTLRAATHLAVWLLLSGLAKDALAQTGIGLPLTYSGRITEASGAPVSGPVTVEAKFWSAETDGSQLGQTIDFASVALTQGLFTLNLELSAAQAAAIFGDGSEPIYIEVSAAGKTYPRQRFTYTPLAMRIPVDNKTLSFDTQNGKLGVNGAKTATSGSVLVSNGNGGVTWDNLSSSNLSAKTSTGGAPTADQVLTYKNGKWVAASLPATTTGNYLTELTGDVIAVGPGSGTASLASVAIPGTATKITFDAKGRVTAGTTLSATDITIALGFTPASNVSITAGTGLSGGQITNSGTISLANTAVTAGTYSRANITVDAQGRITNAQSAPAITDADIASSASIAQSKIAGLSTSLTAKENAIASGTTSDYFRGDKTWQPLTTATVPESGTALYFSDSRARASLSGSGPINYSIMTGAISMAQANAATNGYLASSDWATFNAKQNALGYAPVNKAGDTMSGALDMGSQKITNLGSPTVPTDAVTKSYADAKLAGRTFDVGTPSAGQVIKWDQANQKFYLDADQVGVSGGGISSLNTLTSASQNLTTSTSGSSLGVTSSGSTHTINVPMASLGGVTAGLISNTDYSAFNSKINAVTQGTGIAVATASGTTTVTLANTAVTPGAYTRPNITVDQQGRLTAAANGGNVNLASEITGILPAANGGTGVNSTATYPSTGVVVTRDATETLTNKTLTAPIVSSLVNTGTLTLPTSTDTLVGRATADTLTNKTLAAATINGASTISGSTIINTTGTATTGALTAATVTSQGVVTVRGSGTAANKLVLNDKTNTNYVAFKAPNTLAAAVTWELPETDGAAGQVLSTNGTGTLSWVSGTAPTGAASGDLTGNFPGPTLATVGTAGTYMKVTTDSKGRVTSGATLSSSDLPPISATSLNTGTLAVANGGTGVGSFTNNGVVIGSSSALSSTAAGTQYNILTVNAGNQPTFGTVNLASSNAVGGTLGLANGGTGATTKSGAFDALSPMSAAGDLIYGGTSGTGTKLAGNTTSNKQFLSSTGTGSAANAPAWTALTATDIPAHSAALITSGTLAIANGGTGTSSTTAKYVFAGPTSGTGAPSFRSLVAGDYPTMVGANGTTEGTAGAVPGPAATDNVKFLRGDGTWATPTAAAAGAANQIQYNSGGVLTGNANFVYSGGNVGIGTTAPLTMLDVVKSGTNDPLLRVGGPNATDNPAIMVQNGSGSTGLSMFAAGSTAAFLSNSDVGDVGLRRTGSGNMLFGTGGSAAALAITSSGNVGIGTTTPAGKLDVAGSICLNGANCITSWPNAGGYWATSGSDSYVASGKLGVGTSSPGADLSFGGSLSRTIQVDRNTGAGTAGGGLRVQAGGAISGGSNHNGGTLTLASGVATGTGTSSIEFKTASAGSSGETDSVPTTKMTILGNGNVGIGTAAPGRTLDVAGAVKVASTIFAGNKSVYNFTGTNFDSGYSGSSISTTSYYKIATLSPNSSFGNGDSVRITGQLGNMSYDQLGTVDITVANRSHPTFAVSGSVIGNVLANSHDLLGCYNSDGSTDIYLKLQQGDYPTWNLNISATRNAVINDNPSLTTTAPVPATGYSLVSLVFNSSVMWQGWTGNVGIGTTAPSSQLHVAATLPNSGPEMTIENLSGTSASAGFRFKNSVRNWGLFVRGDANNILALQDDTASAIRMAIDANGNVGIGTVAPNAALNVVVGTGKTPITTQAGSAGVWQIGQNVGSGSGDDTWGIYSATYGSGHGFAPVMTATSGGKVGIGTTNPGSLLQVGTQIGASTATPVVLSLGGTYSSTPGANMKLRLFDDTNASNMYGLGISNQQLESIVPTGGRFAWFIGGTEKVKIDTNGNVGIGTTAPTAALDVGTGSIGMGYEHVVATCPSAGACSVSCSAGKQVLGGGCDLATNAVLQTKPNSTNGWTCTATGTTYMNVWAICARIK